MNPKKFIISLIVTMGFLMSVGVYAATCYDPYYDSYYPCRGPQYYYPDDGVLFNFVVPFGGDGYYNSGYYGHRGYNNNYHGGHQGYHGSRGNYGHQGYHGGGGGGHHH
ncbi:MAG: hypothetical protein P4M14_07095 [Gammaproteobacteria bacterium]|nr:hypothetical protein [Gammaproteobacteria bacterium]